MVSAGRVRPGTIFPTVGRIFGDGQMKFEVADAKLAKACSLSTDVSQDTFEDILMLSQATETSSAKLIQADTPEAA